MTTPRAANPTGLATTRRFALGPREWATTAVAAVVSTAAYVSEGHSSLARRVVGDLLGFAVLGAGGLATNARVQHEAAVYMAIRRRICD